MERLWKTGKLDKVREKLIYAKCFSYVSSIYNLKIWRYKNC